MNEVLEQSKPRQDVLDALREQVGRGASVRDLIRVIHEMLRLPTDAVIPVLWYFTQAFDLTLQEVLPLRELMETDEDEEMDELMRPMINRARSRDANNSPPTC